MLGMGDDSLTLVVSEKGSDSLTTPPTKLSHKLYTLDETHACGSHPMYLGVL